MSIVSALGLALAVLVLAMSPGPGVLATVARALASGFRPSLAVICGIVLGDITYLLLAVFGLSMVSHVLGDLFFVVKICGGAYLVGLGIRLWLKKPAPLSADGNGRDVSGLGNLAGGLAITLSNPKVILFYCGFLPSFLDVSALSSADVLASAAIVATVLTGVLVIYAFLASRARRLFVGRRAVRNLNRAAGGAMITSGVIIATRS